MDNANTQLSIANSQTSNALKQTSLFETMFFSARPNVKVRRHVYVVTKMCHTDDYKQVETYTEICGVFDNFEAAANLAVHEQLDGIEDPNDWKLVRHMLKDQKFETFADIWDTDFHVKLNNQEGEFTFLKGGQYVKIEYLPIDSRCKYDMPAQEYLSNEIEKLDEYADET